MNSKSNLEENFEGEALIKMLKESKSQKKRPLTAFKTSNVALNKNPNRTVAQNLSPFSQNEPK